MLLFVMLACSTAPEAVPEPTPEPRVEAPAPADGPAWQFPGAKRWDEQTPSSSMRVTQWSVPGDAGPAELEQAGPRSP